MSNGRQESPELSKAMNDGKTPNPHLYFTLYPVTAKMFYTNYSFSLFHFISFKFILLLILI